ncbi:unnamed protein product, partial [Porites lobata]
CYSETSDPVLHVTLLGGEWGSSAGGLSTINRELAIHLSQQSAVKVSLLVPEGACNNEEKNEAHNYGITIVETKRRAAFDRLDWLSFPPHEHLMDIVVGHGVKLGRQIQVIRDSARFPNCKWVQVVHTAPEDLSRCKCYTDPISKGETKHESEVELCKLADLVVPVGPRLKEAYASYLQRCKTDQDILRRMVTPEGKQEEVREKLLQRGIAEAQLTVRKFIQSRDRLKDLLCEADLAIMPSKSEGFGLVALEALSASLPIIVGSKSGIAKALEHVPIGHSCVVNSDDPAEWGKAIEDVRDRHRMRLEEIRTLRASYGEMYNWKEQCEELVKKMWEMVHGMIWSSIKIDSKPTTNSLFEEQLVAGSSHFRTSENKASISKGKKTEKSTMKGYYFSKVFSLLSDIITRHNFQELNDEQRKIVHETLQRQIQLYLQHRTIATSEGVSGLIEYIKKTHNVALESVGLGSLEVKFRCTSLESLESLWNDYQSGHLNHIAERYLVTDDIRRKLNCENVRLKTTIDEENYQMCEKILKEKSWELQVLSEQLTAVQLKETENNAYAKFWGDKQRTLWHVMVFSGVASRGPLHKAAVSGQYELVKMLLESGEDVDQRDQFSLTPLHLACWYGQESVVKLLLTYGANVDAEDSFQRTPLQKAERRNHHSIVQLLLKNGARPSFRQPVCLKKLTRKAFLQVDERSGFNLLQATVFEEKYNIVLKAGGLFDNFVQEMELTKTGNNAKKFSGKTAVDLLSLRKRTNPFNVDIKRIYEKLAEDKSGLTELQWGSCNDDVERAVALVLNDGVDINASGSDSGYPALLQASRSSSSQFIETLIDLGADVNAQ